MTTNVLIDPEVDFNTLADTLQRLGWTRDSTKTVTRPILAGEPELAGFRRPGSDNRIVYTFNPVVALRVLALYGEGVALHEATIRANLPCLDRMTIRTMLDATEDRTVLLGILAAQNLGDPSLVPALESLTDHDVAIVAKAAAAAVDALSD